MGELSLREGKVLAAETDLLKAFEFIPDSPQVLILLASVYFAIEEFEKGIEFYDRTLAVSPEYRDALLGKAVCLASLKRFDESIVVLERIIALGYWLLGESHYWLAWNLHELGRDREALESIDQAKGRLPMNSELFGLAGTIASGMGELARAEKDFRESLQYNARNSEALFGLGTICAMKERWPESGQYYESASAAFELDHDFLLPGVNDPRFHSILRDYMGIIEKRQIAVKDRPSRAGRGAMISFNRYV